MPETEKSSQNPNFIKLLATMLAMLALMGGFLMLPGPADMREQAYAIPVGRFLDSFHDVREMTDGQSLPDVALLSPEGRKVDMKAITKGHITIVNFWATWCAPCIEELPSLAKFQASNPDILTMPVSLDMQKSVEDLAVFFAKDELKELRWFYDDSGNLRKQLSLPVYPSTYVLDKNGKIIYILQGPSDWSSSDASAFAKYLLSKS
ncbi:MAG: hypothetical protein DI586_10570 [Micavibrio aeruginosavorus]|uniref:Thioredoxin domain-containing protein n=1 Tax=Micavibrio aeruginosavorus TaxID=349221 RepID=A0A2W5FCV1_9BACT|nr:MAG: hypothetical protein DI586_10570 [Micavibrio aeruginosavorus]